MSPPLQELPQGTVEVKVNGRQLVAMRDLHFAEQAAERGERYSLPFETLVGSFDLRLPRGDADRLLLRLEQGALGMYWWRRRQWNLRRKRCP